MDQNWTPEAIAEAARSFQVSRIIITAAELDLFTRLTAAGKTAQELASELEISERGGQILLDALAALGMLEKEGASYRLPGHLEPALSSRSPESILPLILHMSTLWNRWSRLTEVVRRGSGFETSSWEDRPEAERRAFIGAMHVIGVRMAHQIVESIDTRGLRRVLDVGGASGTYTVAFLRANNELRATLLDLPSVIPLAKERLEAEGLLERVDLVGADFEREELPSGHDMVFISAIVHQNDRIQNRDLFAKAYRALVPGGRIVIRDHVMDPSRTWPAQGAIFAVNMLVSTKGGNTYTFEELREDLEAVGFVAVKWTRRGERMDSLIEATRP